MKSRALVDKPEKIWAIIFEKNEEVLKGLKAFAIEHQLSASHFTAIGAFNGVLLGYFDPGKKDYTPTRLREQVEVLSMIGDITLSSGQPQVHVHVVVGRSDATTRGGHLLEGFVWPTLEVILNESPAHLHRAFDPETGLGLITP